MLHRWKVLQVAQDFKGFDKNISKVHLQREEKYVTIKYYITLKNECC